MNHGVNLQEGSGSKRLRAAHSFTRKKQALLYDRRIGGSPTTNDEISALFIRPKQDRTLPGSSRAGSPEHCCEPHSRKLSIQSPFFAELKAEKAACPQGYSSAGGDLCIQTL